LEIHAATNRIAVLFEASLSFLDVLVAHCAELVFEAEEPFAREFAVTRRQSRFTRRLVGAENSSGVGSTDRLGTGAVALVARKVLHALGQIRHGVGAKSTLDAWDIAVAVSARTRIPASRIMVNDGLTVFGSSRWVDLFGRLIGDPALARHDCQAKHSEQPPVLDLVCMIHALGDVSINRTDAAAERFAASRKPITTHVKSHAQHQPNHPPLPPHASYLPRASVVVADTLARFQVKVPARLSSKQEMYAPLF